MFWIIMVGGTIGSVIVLLTPAHMKMKLYGIIGTVLFSIFWVLVFIGLVF
jgi:hypothetical protein